MAALRTLSIALGFLLLLAGKANAQASVYATVMGGNFGFAGDAYQNGPSWKPHTFGFTGGAFLSLITASRFKPGLDIRGTYSPGFNGGRTYTAAMRLGFVPERAPFRPYAQFGGGYASTQQQNCAGPVCSTNRVSGGLAQLNVGLDIRLTPQVDIRAFDYARYSAGSAGNTSPAARSFSAGLVYHTHRQGLSSP